MVRNLSRAWACSLLIGTVGLVVAGTTKNAAHWRGDGAFLWLVVMLALAAGVGSGLATSRPFEPWLPLLLTVSLPAPVALTVLGLLIRAAHSYDVPVLVVVAALLLAGAFATAAAAGVWLLRHRLSGQAAPWKAVAA